MDAASIKRQFLAAYKDATTTILHDDGLYRHIRVKGRHYYRFELITWPGSLFVNAEGDGYTFARLLDMFEFFRHGDAAANLDPNFSYWAEKLYDSRSQKVRAFDYDAFARDIESEIATIADERRARDIRHDFEWECHQSEGSCHAFLSRHEEFESLRSESDWHDWTFRYAYACFAICFGIQEYDRLKADAEPSAATGEVTQ
jgi:hypothetical protein